MTGRSVLLIFGLLLVSSQAFSQGKNTLKEKKVESSTVYEYFLEEGIKDPVIETIEKYDAEGNLIELKEFNSEGEIKNWQRYKYDTSGNKVEEITLTIRGTQEERVTWIYKNDLLVEKQYFDHRDRMVKRKEYKYEYRAN